jgi:hypothetical protein
MESHAKSVLVYKITRLGVTHLLVAVHVLLVGWVQGALNSAQLEHSVTSVKGNANVRIMHPVIMSLGTVTVLQAI